MSPTITGEELTLHSQTHLRITALQYSVERDLYSLGLSVSVSGGVVCIAGCNRLWLTEAGFRWGQLHSPAAVIEMVSIHANFNPNGSGTYECLLYHELLARVQSCG